MQLSANYGLKLMEGTDNVKRQDFVDNFSAIDILLKVIDDNSYPPVTATGTNTYIGSTDRIKALSKGAKLTLFVETSATGNCTLNLNSYGAKNIKDSFGNIVTNLKVNIPYNLCYNGTDFIVQGKGGGGDATADQILNGKKVTVDSGPIVGTMPNQPAQVNALSVGSSGTNKYFRIPNGAYLTNAGSGYPEIIATATQIDSNINSNNIKSGISICGIAGKSSVVDTSDGTATASQIVNGYSAYVNGNKINGTASIESLGGRKVASGSVTSVSTSSTFQYIDGTTCGFPTATVNGLSFKPSVVVLKKSDATVVYEEIGIDYTNAVRLSKYNAKYYSTTNFNVKGDVLPANVYNGGFVLPVIDYNATYSWIAYE